MLQENFPYGMVSRFQQHNAVSFQLLRAAYMCDDTVLITKISNSLKKDLEQQKDYYAQLSEKQLEPFEYDSPRGGKSGDKVFVDEMLKEMKRLDNDYKASKNKSPEIISNPTVVPNKDSGPKKDTPIKHW